MLEFIVLYIPLLFLSFPIPVYYLDHQSVYQNNYICDINEDKSVLKI